MTNFCPYHNFSLAEKLTSRDDFLPRTQGNSNFFYFNFFKFWKYDNTFIGNLENIEQGYV